MAKCFADEQATEFASVCEVTGDRITTYDHRFTPCSDTGLAIRSANSYVTTIDRHPTILSDCESVNLPGVCNKRVAVYVRLLIDLRFLQK